MALALERLAPVEATTENDVLYNVIQMELACMMMKRVGITITAPIEDLE